MTYLLYLLGFLPSIIWLFFYLRKDAHPESNSMIVRIFFFGILSAFLAIALEMVFHKASEFLDKRQVLNSLFAFFLNRSLTEKSQVIINTLLIIFLGGALIEEYCKYLVVRLGVFRNRELDEPPDILLYMIISGLGFAALENILVLGNIHPTLTAVEAFRVMGWRFISATFLHALCSGVIGYFLALSFLNIRKRRKYFLIGLGIAVALHGIYNWSIIVIETPAKIILPLVILIALSCFVSFSFKKLKRLKSVCKL